MMLMMMMMIQYCRLERFDTSTLALCITKRTFKSEISSISGTGASECTFCRESRVKRKMDGIKHECINMLPSSFVASLFALCTNHDHHQPHQCNNKSRCKHMPLASTSMPTSTCFLLILLFLIAAQLVFIETCIELPCKQTTT